MFVGAIPFLFWNRVANLIIPLFNLQGLEDFFLFFFDLYYAFDMKQLLTSR